MKRHKQLFEKIISFDNLLEAFYKARKGKRSKPAVAAFEFNLERELFRLQTELESGIYVPGGYTSFKIYDPKERLISAAPFRDRVVHHALCNVVEPLFERTFIFDSYANRKGKGVHAAIVRCQHFMRQYRYVLKADIKKYFPSIDHVILKETIRRKIACPRTLRLIDSIIDNSNPQEPVLDYYPGDDIFTPGQRRKGLPIGNQTSQFFSNIFLNGFDHFVQEELRFPYIRYVDDFVMFSNDKQTLHSARQSIITFLAAQLRLRLNERKTHLLPTYSGINFLGQRVFLTRRFILKPNLRRMHRRVKLYICQFEKRALLPDELEQRLNAWLGHARQATMWKFVRKLYNLLYFKRHLPVFRKSDFVWKVLGRRPNFFDTEGSDVK